VLEVTLFQSRNQRRVDEKRDSKYPQFRRVDLHKWTRANLYPGAALLLIPRVFLVLIPGLIVHTFISGIVGVGIKAGQELAPWRRYVYKLLATSFSIMVKVAIGCVFTKQTLSVDEVDFSEYLGPDWKKQVRDQKTLPPTIIYNHSSVFDSLDIHSLTEAYSYVARGGLLRIPAVGNILIGLGTLFIDRTRKEGHEDFARKLQARQKDIQSGKFNRLVVCPEGCESNGTCILPFKKGAFESLLPIEIWV
jgi:lysophosphatidylcholine acyltransferase/lyso-PAF acetyltransferase